MIYWLFLPVKYSIVLPACTTLLILQSVSSLGPSSSSIIRTSPFYDRPLCENALSSLVVLYKEPATWVECVGKYIQKPKRVSFYLLGCLCYSPPDIVTFSKWHTKLQWEIIFFPVTFKTVAQVSILCNVCLCQIIWLFFYGLCDVKKKPGIHYNYNYSTDCVVFLLRNLILTYKSFKEEIIQQTQGMSQWVGQLFLGT